MVFSKELQTFIKQSLEQIHGIQITEQNAREVVFNHFVTHRKLLKNKTFIQMVLDWFQK